MAGLLFLLGALACGVAMLITWPIYVATLALHYTYFFPRRTVPTQWAVEAV